RLEWIDRTVAPGRVLRIGIADLHFMALVHGHPRIGAGIGKSHEHARVGLCTGLPELSAQDEVPELALAEPPQAHAALRRRHAGPHFKTAGAALLPMREL